MDINNARNDIDKIDNELVELIKKRMEIVKNVAQYKQENSLPVFDKSREREILNRVAELSGEELANYNQILFSNLFSVSRSYQNRIITSQSPLKPKIENALKNTPDIFPSRAVVACQGVEGSYSQAACDKLFSNPNIMYFNEFEGVFELLTKGFVIWHFAYRKQYSRPVNEVYDL